jgi:hypothetical protein
LEDAADFGADEGIFGVEAQGPGGVRLEGGIPAGGEDGAGHPGAVEFAFTILSDDEEAFLEGGAGDEGAVERFAQATAAPIDEGEAGVGGGLGIDAESPEGDAFGGDVVGGNGEDLGRDGDGFWEGGKETGDLGDGGVDSGAGAVIEVGLGAFDQYQDRERIEGGLEELGAKRGRGDGFEEGADGVGIGGEWVAVGEG